ncbi:heterokaryon incompatibility protein-domain-containing protein [Astrocystis sublimbata]|nr:heterokaryon incompatibility protein-domain-containing protein [Astrocystis sublimbata]
MNYNIPPTYPDYGASIPQRGAGIFGVKYGYQYSHLSTHRNEIRVLVLEPDLEPSSVLRCRLEHVSLDQADHDFVALSYTWGDDTQETSILLHDSWCAINKNLHLALLELRARGWCRVWADGLCINQFDLEERSQMVLKMGVIYRSAQFVVSYLCTDDQSSLGKAVLAAHLIRRAVRELETWRPATQDRDRDRRRPKFNPDDDLEAKMATWADEMCPAVAEKLQVDAESRAALNRLVHHAYWTRIWIIQEISMNPRLEIIWAQSTFDIGEFAMVLRILSHDQGIGSQWRRQHIQQLADIRNSQLRLKSISLVHALRRCRLAEASIPRDRLYALLGLTHDGAKLVSFPSYRMKSEDICRDITQKLIQATGKIDMVVLLRRKDLSAPWHPDWFARDTWTQDSAPHGPAATPDWTGLRPDGGGGPVYAAAGKEKALVETHPTHAVFAGFSLGRVTACSPTLDEAKASVRPELQIVVDRTWHAKDATAMPKLPAKSAKRLLASLRFLLCEIATHKGKPPLASEQRDIGLLQKLLSRRQKDVSRHAAHLLRWLNCCEQTAFAISGLPFTRFFFEENKRNVAAPPPKKFKTVCENFQRILEANMRLATLSTDDGGGGGDGGGERIDFLAWLPMEARVGDEVFVLLGASMPCVLRRKDDMSGFHGIVGPCFVDGAMNGEQVRRGLRELQDVMIT